MNRVHVMSQHNEGLKKPAPLFINRYIIDKDEYEYISKTNSGKIHTIAETPRETISYIKSSASIFKLELLYD